MADVIGKRIIITGEVNTGKTTLSKALMEGLVQRGLGARMAVVDMAPEVPEAIALERGIKGIGGRLAPPSEEVFYLRACVRAPRLTTKTETEALVVAGENRDRIARLLDAFGDSGRDILFINDVSMYLQAGSASDLLGRMEAASTVVANGYRGRALGSGVLSMREAQEMEKLIAAFPYHVRLPGGTLEETIARKEQR